MLVCYCSVNAIGLQTCCEMNEETQRMLPYSYEVGKSSAFTPLCNYTRQGSAGPGHE